MKLREKLSRKHKNDLILIFVLLAGCLLYFGLHRAAPSEAETRNVVIFAGGDEVFHGPLSAADGPLTIKGADGGSNVFIMEKDEKGQLGLRCVEADCPEQICVHTGLVTLPDEPIVCLPHRVTARIIE